MVKENKCGLKIIEMTKNYKVQIGDFLREDNEAIFDEMKESDNSSSGRTESWYTYWGLGYSSISYPPDIQSALNYIKSQPGVSNVTICLDLLGFYWHISQKLIGGIIINGVLDRYYDSYGYYFQINQYNYSVSFIKYIGKYFGSGFFIRSDIGIARYVYQSNIDGNYTSDIGFGLLVGGGYSFDLGGTRLLLNCNYGFRSIEQNEAGSLSFSIGGLF